MFKGKNHQYFYDESGETESYNDSFFVKYEDWRYITSTKPIEEIQAQQNFQNYGN